jgi:hypothetical protein
VAIAIGVRNGEPRSDNPAVVHYSRINGTKEEKLKALAQMEKFGDLPWRECLPGWNDLFLPTSDKAYWDWPLVTDIFPWQVTGVMAGRTWPIAPNVSVLNNRWKILLKSKERRMLFKDSPTGRQLHLPAPLLPPKKGKPLPTIERLTDNSPTPVTIKYSFRSLDQQWLLADSRLIDRPSPDIWRIQSDCQIYITSLLTKVLGEGPSALATAQIPDKDHFSNRGAKDVIPLWRDAEATEPNITGGVLEVLSKTYGQAITPEDLFAYFYALIASPEYVRRFWDELTIPGPRLPITKDAALFNQAAKLGRQLIWLHTYGERLVPTGHKPVRVPPGKTKCLKGNSANPKEYPETFSYEVAEQKLHVGQGVFAPVRQEVWEFSVSGFEVVKSWLAYRMKKGAGKKSSPLDDIRPEQWEFDEELLDLLWVLEHTLEMCPKLRKVLNTILAGELFNAKDFPEPTAVERAAKKEAPLFEMGDG